MEIPRHWRLKKQRYGLVGSICPWCDEKKFPPVEVCKKCQERDEELQKLTIVYDSSFFLPPNNQVVHSEVVRQN